MLDSTRLPFSVRLTLPTNHTITSPCPDSVALLLPQQEIVSPFQLLVGDGNSILSIRATKSGLMYILIAVCSTFGCKTIENVSERQAVFAVEFVIPRRALIRWAHWVGASVCNIFRIVAIWKVSKAPIAIRRDGTAWPRKVSAREIKFLLF